jgi:hypothetical protein
MRRLLTLLYVHPIQNIYIRLLIIGKRMLDTEKSMTGGAILRQIMLRELALFLYTPQRSYLAAREQRQLCSAKSHMTWPTPLTGLRYLGMSWITFGTTSSLMELWITESEAALKLRLASRLGSLLALCVFT